MLSAFLNRFFSVIIINIRIQEPEARSHEPEKLLDRINRPDLALKIVILNIRPFDIISILTTG